MTALFGQAKAGYEEVLALMERICPRNAYPNGHEFVPSMLVGLGMACQNLGDHAAAVDNFRKAVDLIKAQHAQGGRPRDEFLRGLPAILRSGAEEVDSQSGHEIAEKYFRLLVEVVQMLLASRDDRELLAMESLGWKGLCDALEDQRKFVEAVDGYRRIQELQSRLIVDETNPAAKPYVATVTHDLGFALKRAGRSGEAIEQFQAALKLWRELFPGSTHPKGHPEIANTLASLGLALLDEGDFDAALQAERECLAMRERLPADDELAIPATLRSLGRILCAKGKLEEAAAYFQQSLTLCRKLYPVPKYPKGHLQIAAALCQIGFIHSDQGDDAEAMRYLRQATEMEIAGDDAAETLEQMALLLQRVGEHVMAKKYATQALAISRQLFPKDKFPQGHRDLAASMMHLASVEWDPGSSYLNDREGAGKFYAAALEMYERLNSKDSPRGSPAYAECLWRSALYKAQWIYGGKHVEGDESKAEELSRRSLEMLSRLYPEERYPDGHTALAAALVATGSMLTETGEFVRATGYFDRGIAMMERLYLKGQNPLGHAAARAYYELGRCWVSRGNNYPRAWRCLRQSTEMFQRLTASYLASASQAESLNYQANRPPALELMLSIAHQIPAADEVLYEGFLERKSAIYRATQRRQQLVQNSSDTEVRDLGRKLSDVRRRLARQLHTTTNRDEVARLGIEALSNEKEKLERKIAERLPRDPLAENPGGMVRELQRSLPKGAALVDIVQSREFWRNPLSNGQVFATPEMCYVAFVVRPDTPPILVELTGPVLLDPVIRRWRNEIEGRTHEHSGGTRLLHGRSVSIGSGDVRYSADRRGILGDDGVSSQHGNRDQTLRATIWEPIEREFAAGTTTVVIAPDGELARLPWAALLGNKRGRVLLEDYALSVVPNGLVLLDRPANRRISDARSKGLFLGIGDVRYGQDPETSKPENSGAEAIAATGGSYRVMWPELPGTKAELDAIISLTGTRETLLLRQVEPTPNRVLAELSRARWAHFATHGLFADLDSPLFNPYSLSPARKDQRAFFDWELRSTGMGRRERIDVFRRNPQLFSNIVLAGANRRRAPGDDRVSEDDGGLLTAESVEGLPLQGLDLAVLSACESGLGELTEADGFLGLQRRSTSRAPSMSPRAFGKSMTGRLRRS